jgi:hypothetical protein
MKWLAIVAVLGAFLLGATAIDKNDEQSCKDRYVSDIRERYPGASPDVVREDAESGCDGFLPW